MTFNFTVKEFILGNGTGTPVFQFYKRGFELNGGSVSPTWRDVILHGNTALTLVNAKADSLEYLKLFGGTEQLPETYLDTVTLSGGCEQRNLPSGYTQVNYVTNTEQTLVDTGVKFDFSKNYEIELKASGFTGSWYILQSRKTTTSNITGIAGSSAGNQIGLNFDGIYVATSQTPRVVGHIYNIKGTINDGNLTLYVKDETAGIEETVTGTYTPRTGQSVNIGLFGNLAGNRVNINSDVYFARIKEDGNYIMDYVPCKQGTTAGFYDKVSNTFKTATSLSAGADVVPSPDTPMDIVCNNGVIKVRHQSGLPLGYTLLDYIASSGTQAINTGVKYSGNDFVVKWKAVDTTISSNTTLFACVGAIPYSGGLFGNKISRPYYIGSSSSLNISYESNDNNFHEWELTVSGQNITLKKDGVQVGTETFADTINTTHDIYLFCGGWTNNTNQSLTQFSSWQLGYWQLWKSGTLVRNFIPAKNSSNVIGMYDTVTDTFFTNAGTGDFTAGNTVSDPIEIYTDGTVETVTDSNGLTASAERLLAVGNYKDTQEVLSGSVTRNVGIKVLDGTEEWNNQAVVNCWSTTADNLASVSETNRTIYCNYFQSTSTVPTNRQGYCFKGHNSGSSFVSFGSVTQFSTVTKWNNWLATQYANGTPVIIVYPTNSATTETVTPQLLLKSPVTQTAGSISNLPIAITESQKTTPTPTQPLQINCNNGVVKLSPNLLNPDTITNGYRLTDTGTVTLDTNAFYTGYIPVIAGSTYTYNQSTGSSIILRICEYDSTNALVKLNKYTAASLQTVTITMSANASYIIISADNRFVSNPPQLELGSTATQYRPYGQIYTDGTTETVEITGKNLFDKNDINLQYRNRSLALSKEGYWYFVDGSTSLVCRCLPNTQYTISGINSPTSIFRVATIDVDTLPSQEDRNEIPYSYIYRTTQDEVHTFVTPSTAKWIIVQISATIFDSTLNTIQIELGSTATTYEPYYYGGQATAEMLLKIGTYQDVQSVIDGGVTRNVGILVLDGTEDWERLQQNNTYFSLLRSNILPRAQAGENLAGYCSHFKVLTSGSNPWRTQIGIGWGSSYLHINYNNEMGSLSSFKQYLASQYQAGTPVIVVYPLATPTTETVTAQPMNIQEGTNNVTITQASMDNLELEVKYKAGVEVTITEIENAQLDDNVEVTING